jgi:hypothetical protein
MMRAAEWLLMLVGLAPFLLGVLLFAAPGTGALVVACWMGMNFSVRSADVRLAFPAAAFVDGRSSAAGRLKPFYRALWITRISA